MCQTRIIVLDIALAVMKIVHFFLMQLGMDESIYEVKIVRLSPKLKNKDFKCYNYEK